MNYVRTYKTKSARDYNRVMRIELKDADEYARELLWSPVATLRVAVRSRAGRLAVEGAQETEVIKYDLYSPWEPAIGRILMPARERRLVDEDGREFYVESVIDLDDAHREFKITCTERP